MVLNIFSDKVILIFNLFGKLQTVIELPYGQGWMVSVFGWYFIQWVSLLTYTLQVLNPHNAQDHGCIDLPTNLYTAC
ncbi:hypothetical protein EDC63_101625 [Sulfurirhabdus autotrophica]|uniref:Uncharacterized protein n=1 Tax=Sulfurirhabdus autotrophica TaxID=1706046 RepID=A0A4R3YFA4_9PROT|nr:hypothetical protein EDC63_101625 [Sulfurirhabdus autotrophica]